MSAERLIEHAGRSARGEVVAALQTLLDAVRDAWAAAEATTIGEGEAQRWSPVCTAALALAELSERAS